MRIITTTILILGLLNSLMAQHYSETEQREIAFKDNSRENVFYLANISGAITVEGYQGDKVILRAVKTVKAKSQAGLEQSRSALSLEMMDRGDTIIAYIKSPCATFNYKKRQGWPHKNTGWGYKWSDCEYEYDFKYDFVLQVPEHTNLYLATINEGDVRVVGMQGDLDVNNVNGGITLEQVSGKMRAYTVNGDVTVAYKDLPGKASSCYTLNGNINALYPKGLKAELTFKSFNGDFYTNIKKLEYQPVVVKKEKVNKKDGPGYRVSSRSVISVGGGGVALDFETFNGNVFVKEQ